jgi:hypothetical protein
MTHISGAAVPVRNPRLAWREMDGEVIIISPEDNFLHELNETASLLWSHADGVRDLAQIAARIAEAYDVPIEEARVDAAELIAALVERKLLSMDPVEPNV